MPIIQGDCLAVLPTLPAESVHACVTDPPYGLSFMGKGWDHGVPGEPYWREVLRVLKPGAHLLAFGGTRTYHRLACAIEDAGFEIRDCVMWVYGSGFPKSLDVAKQEGCEDWQGWGTALKPAWEPIIVARKPLEGTVAKNVLAHGTGALNIDGCRVGGKPSPSVSRRTCAAPGGSVGATGWVTPARPESYNEPRPGELLGRWPANLMHDGSDEVLAAFPDSNGSGPARTLKRGKREGDWGMADQPGSLRDAGEGSAARFFYCPKAAKKDRNEGCEHLPDRTAGECTDRQDDTAGLDSPRAGAGRTSGSKNHHPTVKPTELMRYLCRLVTPPGGTVLDPFAGSGSTGKAAALEGFGFTGIEMESEYVAVARARLEWAENQMLETLLS
ncbi:MAG TPA: site-specific DNA-methyltransferase [Arenicellales bacterium]|nr:site-specific DNA-methyltransferase [Arenicellales bacterium]